MSNINALDTMINEAVGRVSGGPTVIEPKEVKAYGNFVLVTDAEDVTLSNSKLSYTDNEFKKGRVHSVGPKVEHISVGSVVFYTDNIYPVLNLYMAGIKYSLLRDDAVLATYNEQGK